MTKTELQASISLAAVFFLRMLGLFSILPVFTIYARDTLAAPPILAGLAVGIFGLTQACLQIPLGILSDRIGRKPVIIAGLLIYMVGGVIACYAESIWVIILGRALQGAGAIAAAIMALVADLTSEENRSKGMAIVGIGVGLSFVVAMVVGPLVNEIGGVPSIFALSVGVAFFAIIILISLVPKAPPVFRSETQTVPSMLLSVVRHHGLRRLCFGIFVLHATMLANYSVLPIMLYDGAGLPLIQHWQVYLPTILISALLMAPVLIFGERYGKTSLCFKGMIFLLLLSQLSQYYWYNGTLLLLICNLLMFFVAFNYLEATIPSLVSKLANADSRGTAMGFCATCQLMGVFVGAFVGGIIREYLGLSSIFIFNVLIVIAWLFLALQFNTWAKKPLD